MARGGRCSGGCSGVKFLVAKVSIKQRSRDNPIHVSAGPTHKLTFASKKLLTSANGQKEVRRATAIMASSKVAIIHHPPAAAGMVAVPRLAPVRLYES